MVVNDKLRQSAVHIGMSVSRLEAIALRLAIFRLEAMYRLGGTPRPFESEVLFDVMSKQSAVSWRHLLVHIV